MGSTLVWCCIGKLDAQTSYSQKTLAGDITPVISSVAYIGKSYNILSIAFDISQFFPL